MVLSGHESATGEFGTRLKPNASKAKAFIDYIKIYIMKTVDHAKKGLKYYRGELTLVSSGKATT